ncbi:serine/threonine protein kinase [Pseudomonas sp. StFLB209]|nr:serine/threonine protein kinase [Pseudomonas sp. StFLB209]
MPEAAVFTLEHDVAAHTFGSGRKEVADGDLFAGFKREDQILAIARHRCHLARGNGHLHDAGSGKLQVAPLLSGQSG